jgi:hypothetical protein
MKILILIFSLILFTGCFVTPEEPIVVSPIICEGGHYIIHFQDWQMCLCPHCEIYPEGTYWLNKDDRMFLIGEPVINPITVYGGCPEGYIQEI